MSVLSLTYPVTMKDNFSKQSAGYARFRPTYPSTLYKFLFQHVQQFGLAWDCATGNGQVAVALAGRFQQVVATDISQNQLAHALTHPVIAYRCEPAHHSSLEENSVDLITVGQAAHWFDLEKFYAEVWRVMRPGGLLALIGYGLMQVDERTDRIIRELYTGVLGDFWDAERVLVDEAYASLPFPFEPIPFPKMEMVYEWSRDHLTGFLQTWSAVQHFHQKTERSPFSTEWLAALYGVWPEGEQKTVRFPMFGRIGK